MTVGTENLISTWPPAEIPLPDEVLPTGAGGEDVSTFRGAQVSPEHRSMVPIVLGKARGRFIVGIWGLEVRPFLGGKPASIPVEAGEAVAPVMGAEGPRVTGHTLGTPRAAEKGARDRPPRA